MRRTHCRPTPDEGCPLSGGKDGVRQMLLHQFAAILKLPIKEPKQEQAQGVWDQTDCCSHSRIFEELYFFYVRVSLKCAGARAKAGDFF